MTALHLSVMYADVPRPECSFVDVTWTPFSCSPPSRRRDTEFKLEEALRATDEERARGVSVEAEASRLREEMKQAEQSWQRFVLFPRGGTASSGRPQHDTVRVALPFTA